MGYYVGIRGPLGVGKTTVSRQLAKRLGAKYVSIDRILDDRGLWVQGRLSEFLRANEFAGAIASRSLRGGRPVIFDGNFYWRSQIRDLSGRLDWPGYFFSLKAPLRVCIERDGRRHPPHGAEAARAVFLKTERFDYGIAIDANRPARSVVDEILSKIPRLARRGASPSQTRGATRVASGQN